MQILWGALRAVSVETMGVLVVLWMLYGATGLAIDAPWWATKSQPVRNEQSDVANTHIARVEPERAENVSTDVAPVETARDKTQRATVAQYDIPCHCP